ncbi:MAG: hypothetical protein PHF51_02210 [Candidatus ainarchaeum sp.]|nr:hypothetical protein [Candidatus ainarchaeum sp.]
MTDVVESFNCAQCGAPLKIREGEAVAVCEYCGSLNSLRADKTYIIKHSWMPNKLTKDEALRKAGEWMRGGMLMPPGLDEKAVTGASLAYVPLWVFDAKARTDYSGVFLRGGGKEGKRVQGSEEKEFYWKVLGRRQSSFPVKEYKVPLSQKVPFSLEDLMRGEMLNSELDVEEAKAAAAQEIEGYMRGVLSEKVDRFDSLEVKIDFGEPELVHVPVWFMEFGYKGGSYRLVMEGSDGGVLSGEIPPSDFLGGEMRLVIAIAAALVLVAACAFIALNLLR